ncbi:hypothetical protein Lfu02_45670 [Longispora fulva]|uniref:Uncharacterized protein n=1 Tax=Longispora fulva TaxID=619741 RepID=A0A8J7KXJ9_9ACTN|nr:hypothetical protein [Longispora fulva]MBG6137942.1 hypothetical protein [Longispora fulva]GIG60195.1 hypothetical protein Lfu02_45670 [Longispora fulva]
MVLRHRVDGVDLVLRPGGGTSGALARHLLVGTLTAGVCAALPVAAIAALFRLVPGHPGGSADALFVLGLILFGYFLILTLIGARQICRLELTPPTAPTEVLVVRLGRSELVPVARLHGIVLVEHVQDGREPRAAGVSVEVDVGRGPERSGSRLEVDPRALADDLVALGLPVLVRTQTFTRPRRRTRR